MRASFLVLFLSISGCGGGTLCADCKQCPTMCPPGYTCQEARLIENGGAVSYHCGLSPSKALMTLPPIVDGGTD